MTRLHDGGGDLGGEEVGRRDQSVVEDHAAEHVEEVHHC